jgi:hypothetical protein
MSLNEAEIHTKAQCLLFPLAAPHSLYALMQTVKPTIIQNYTIINLYRSWDEQEVNADFFIRNPHVNLLLGTA